MKKIVLLCMSLITFMMISSCRVRIADENQDKAVADEASAINESYVFQDTDESNLAAIAFIGYGNEEKEKNLTAFCEQYGLDVSAFTEVVDIDDCEWYVIFPKYKGEEITISHIELNEAGELVKTGELMTTTEPVLLCCNISDIIPSVEITVTNKEETLTFQPFISLKNGLISEYEGVYSILWQE